MRRQDKEIKDPAQVRAILAEAPCCRVAMVDGDRPYVIPVSFVLDGDALFVHSADHGRKLRILRRNPHVCFEVDADVSVAPAKSACDVGMRFRSVIGTGVVSFVDDSAEKARVLRLFIGKYTPAIPGEMPDHELRKTVVWRVAIERLSGKRSGR
ncbi:MAG TPA: pyridoxamine 5'-phosphate oxidase family protein [Anaeromyxobacteraceae bacterium]|nr:pyridoxamine 5'-phosphate oxidase family protein [Anaeromyxobacteraceae bacterium]